ncbi:MAG: copper resistance protein B [Gammaproteobacteria bacterium]|nr:copper resistance protein B [Gammaproteobacteria bacterium]
MLKAFILFTTLVYINASSAAGMVDDPVLTMVKIDQLELSDSDNNTWDAQAWLGKDLNKLWLKTEGELTGSDVEEAEIQLLYSRAIAPYWDAQIGWRHDLKPEPNRDWLAIGVKGLAPYFFETDIALFIGEHGNIGVRGQFEYELMLTQKWVLSPEVEFNLFSKNDEDVGIGSGLSDISAGLRLRYEIEREFAPYIGVEWERRFGNSADFARQESESRTHVNWVAGIRIWF